MSSFGSLSLQAKLRLIIVLTSLAALTLTVSVLFAYEVVTYRTGQLSALSIRADVMAANTAAALAFDDPAAALETLSSLRADPHLVQAAVYAKGDRLLAAYAPPGRNVAPPASPPADGHSFGSGRLALAAPVSLRGERIGTIYIVEDLEEFYATLRLMATAAGLMLLTALAVAYALSDRFQSLVSKPILELAAAAQAVSATQDYSRRVAPGGDDEIGALIAGFNDMLGQIQARDNALKSASESLEQKILDRTAALRAANAELEAFSYTVSHDLRAPLRAVDCFSRLLEEEYGSALDPHAQDYLRRVRGAGQRMDRLISGLLELTQIARAPLHRVPVDLSRLAADLAQELKERQPERRAEFVVQPGLVALGDPTLLRAVLQNLLENAWKFTAKHASARIEFGRANVGGAYFVRDDGAGFDMAAAQNLFGAFSRLHPAGEFPGTGIGLASVARIVARHGGRIWAEAAVEKGATVHFTLEAGTADDNPGPRAQAAPGPETLPSAARVV